MEFIFEISIVIIKKMNTIAERSETFKNAILKYDKIQKLIGSHVLLQHSDVMTLRGK